MSTKTESIIQESLGNKPYCTKKQLIDMCLNLGICGSPSGAISALKSLPWLKVSTKRTIVSRSAVIDFFNNTLIDKSEKTSCEKEFEHVISA